MKRSQSTIARRGQCSHNPAMKLLSIAIVALMGGCAAGFNSGSHSDPRALMSIKLATWNMEWLVSPPAFRALRSSCLPKGTEPAGRQRYLPCDVAHGQERSAQDFAALARYAQKLDADVIALEEVDGESAAKLVFSGYAFCFTGRSAVQNTGFAIRRGIPFRCGPDYLPLSLGDTVRRGKELLLFPDEPRELRLLAVHLKSGCPRGSLDSGRTECSKLARQVPLLEEWIHRQAAAGHVFAVLGDFNRDLLHESGPPRTANGTQLNVYAQLDHGDAPEADLRNAAADELFINCSAAQNFSGYIDNILLSRTLAQRRVAGGFERLTYSMPEALQRKLSDHCPVAVRIRLVD